MKKEKNNIFVSDCGNFIAIRIPGPLVSFDVWREDGSEYWEGDTYVTAPGTKGFNSRWLYSEEHARPTKIVGSCTNYGHEKRDGTWMARFELGLYNLQTKETIKAQFKTILKSLAPLYKKRRARGGRNEKER